MLDNSLTYRKLAAIAEAVSDNTHLKMLLLGGNALHHRQLHQIMTRVSPVLLRNQGKTVSSLLAAVPVVKEIKYPHQQTF